MITRADNRKVMELSDRIAGIYSQEPDFTTSDLQGAVEAVIMEAIAYGKTTAKGATV